MKNPLDQIAELLNNVPNETSTVIVDSKGNVVLLNEMVGKTLKDCKVIERSPEEGKKAVFEQLFDAEKVGMKEYRKYFETMKNLARFIEKNLDGPLKHNIKKQGMKSIGEVDFTNLKYSSL